MKRLIYNEFFIIFLLIVLFPFGINLMWKHEVFNVEVRMVITGFFSLLVMMTLTLWVFSLHGEHYWVAYYVQ